MRKFEFTESNSIFIMQLPRGAFHSVRRNIHISDLMEELQLERFTGHCTMSEGKITRFLVFRNGKCILAMSGKLLGNDAIAEILASADRKVDASMSSLTVQQIDLTIEFNRKARLSAQRPAAMKNEPVLTPVIVTGAPADQMTVIKSESFSLGSGPPPPTPVPQEKSPVAGRGEIPPIILPALSNPETESRIENDLLMTNLDDLDSMDIDNFTGRIRDNCETTIRTLHLDHLIHKPAETPVVPLIEEERQMEDEFLVTDLDALDSLDLNTITSRIRDNCETTIRKLHLEYLLTK
jgi:hypothetical protein